MIKKFKKVKDGNVLISEKCFNVYIHFSFEMATRLLPNHDKKTTINIQTGSSKTKKKKNSKMLILTKFSTILTFGKKIPKC